MGDMKKVYDDLMIINLYIDCIFFQLFSINYEIRLIYIELINCLINLDQHPWITFISYRGGGRVQNA